MPPPSGAVTATKGKGKAKGKGKGKGKGEGEGGGKGKGRTKGRGSRRHPGRRRRSRGRPRGRGRGRRSSCIGQLQVQQILDQVLDPDHPKSVATISREAPRRLGRAGRGAPAAAAFESSETAPSLLDQPEGVSNSVADPLEQALDHDQILPFS